MARQYWFKAHHHGYGWHPHTWEGFLVFFIYLGGLVYSFFTLSFTDFLVRFLIFSAVLLIIAYLKGEPTTWRWGDKKKE